MSGIPIAADCTKKWEDMKIRHQYDFITFKVSEGMEIVVDVAGKAGTANYDDFLKAMPAKDCRYAVLEIPSTNKIIFIMWTPDDANVKDKMIYAATRSAVLDQLKGTGKAIQCGSLAELELEKIKKIA